MSSENGNGASGRVGFPGVRTAISILSILVSITIFAPILLRMSPPSFLSKLSVFSVPISADPSVHYLADQELAPMFTPEVLRWANHIAKWAVEYRLNPNLIATVMQIGSCGDPQATSQSGAIGLFRVMPSRFQHGEDFWDPDINARVGLSYLANMLELANGDITQALAGYSQDPWAIGHPETWEVDTRRYVYWGVGIYSDALCGAKQSTWLQQWLQADGQELCKRASRSMSR